MTYGKISPYPTIAYDLCLKGWVPPPEAYIIKLITIHINTGGAQGIGYLIDNYGNLLQDSSYGFTYQRGYYIVRPGFSYPLSNNCIDIIKSDTLLSNSCLQLPNFKETLSIYMELEEAKKEIERLKRCEVELNLLKFCENSVEKKEIKQDLELLQFDTTNTLVSSSEDLL